MSKVLKRLGTQPIKFQYALTLNSLEMESAVEGTIFVLWVRGPRQVASIDTTGQNGRFTWNKQDQAEKQLGIVCTLYQQKGGKLQRKKSSVIVKRKTAEGTQTVGQVTLDLATYSSATGQQLSSSVDLFLTHCSEKARLKFVIHSCEIKGSAGDNDDTMSRLVGFEDSYLDPDSRADWGTDDMRHLPTIDGRNSSTQRTSTSTSSAGDLPLPSFSTTLNNESPQPSDEGSQQAWLKVHGLQAALRQRDQDLSKLKERFAQELQKLEVQVAESKEQLPQIESDRDEAIERADATQVALQGEMVKCQSLARVISMQQSQIEAAEANEKLLKVRLGRLAQLVKAKGTPQGRLSGVTTMFARQGAKDAEAMRKLEVAFFEDQITQSDKTLEEARKAWAATSRMLIEEVHTLQHSSDAMRRMLDEALAAKAGTSQLERKLKAAIQDRLRMRERLSELEYKFMQQKLGLGTLGESEDTEVDARSNGHGGHAASTSAKGTDKDTRQKIEKTARRPTKTNNPFGSSGSNSNANSNASSRSHSLSLQSTKGQSNSSGMSPSSSFASSPPGNPFESAASKSKVGPSPPLFAKPPSSRPAVSVDSNPFASAPSVSSPKSPTVRRSGAKTVVVANPFGDDDSDGSDDSVKDAGNPFA